MTTTHTSTPSVGRELFPNVVDRLAVEKPQDSYALWPTEDGSGISKTTYADLANMTNGLAWWIKQNLGLGEEGSVLTYIGPNDARVIAVGLACMKTGYVMFVTSPRNSAEAHRRLFETLGCNVLLTPDPTPAAAVPVLEAVKPTHITIPSIDELNAGNHAVYAYNKTFEEGRRAPVFIIHTSGSTGFPKPLIWTQEVCLRQISNKACAAPEGEQSLDHFVAGKRLISTLPPFHGAGLSQYLFAAIAFGSTVVVPTLGYIATAQALVDTLKKAPADVAILVPSVVAELANDPELLDYCASHLELILYIGGDLPQAIGDRVASRIRLRCQWGASEVGIPQQLLPPDFGPKDWHYIRFHPCIGAAFEEVTDGVYELVIKRDDGNLGATQLAFAIPGMESLAEYRTRDLFQPHPTIPNAWRWRARADDIIVFLNGEKTNPVSMEQHIEAANPSELSGAIVVGAQRFQAGLLIEPRVGGQTLSTAEKAALIERVWPSVQEANSAAPAHARVEKSMIAVAEKPLVRAGKGTIQRAASLMQYADEIDRIYANAEMGDDGGEDDENAEMLDVADRQAVLRFVRAKVSEVHEGIGDDSTGFFDSGMDSLQALRLTRALQREFDRVGSKLSLSTIYQNPSVKLLADALTRKGGDQPEDGKEVMKSLLATYKGTIEQLPKSAQKQRKGATPSTTDIVLTGSTGGLGTYILQSLLQRPGIGHITCLNRSADGGASVQEKAFASHNFDTNPLRSGSRVSFLCANMAHPKLGLDDKAYDALLGDGANQTVIIHNAWPVNFNLSLSAFRPQLAGLVNLFGLATKTAQPASLLFVSSVGAVGRYTAGPAPERIFGETDADLNVPFASGYAQSKFVAEILCAAASRHLEIPAAVARLGQVAGAIESPGIWTEAEWLPSLVLGSMRVGCVPDSLGSRWNDVDWIPVDVVAESIVDLVLGLSPLSETMKSEVKPEVAVYNLRNPKVVDWRSTLLPAVIDEIRRRKGGLQLEPVSPAAWIDSLHQDLESSRRDLGDNSALKLLEFYRDAFLPQESDVNRVQPMAVENAIRRSRTMRELEGIKSEWMRKWVREWIGANK